MNTQEFDVNEDIQQDDGVTRFELRFVATGHVTTTTEAPADTGLATSEEK